MKTFLSHILILFILFLLWNPVVVNAQTVTLSMESGTGSPGDDVSLAINTTNTTGMGIISMQFQLNFDGAILIANDATTNGTIASGWTIASNSSNGRIDVSMAGASALSGSGKLAIINFTVQNTANPGSSTIISIDNISINEGGVNAEAQNGTFTVAEDNPPETVNLMVGTGSADPGATDVVPVTISDVTGLGLIAAEFSINFDPSALEVVNVSVSGTIADGWTVSHNVINNTLLVSMGSPTALSGSGDLVNIELRAKSTAATGQEIPLIIDNIELNEGNIPSEGQDGLFSITGGISGDAVVLSVPTETTGSPGGVISIPVRIKNGIDKNLIAISFDLEFDGSLLSGTSVSVDGSVVSNWSLSYNIETGQIRIAIAGVQSLSADGIIATIEMSVAGTAASGASSDISITNVLLNEGGIVYRVENGVVNISSTMKINGEVIYYNGNAPIASVDIDLGGAASRATMTNSSGMFEFDQLTSGNYTVTPTKSGEINDAVGHYDASLILRNYVGTIPFTDYEKRAADVSGDGRPTAYDAALILQYVVGLIADFPIGVEWLFVPPVRSYTPLTGNVTDADFTGIVVGDPSGNWSATGAGSVSTTGTAVICLPDTVLTNSDSIKWPVKISAVAAAEIYSFGFDINYDMEQLELVNISNQNTLSTSWGNPTYSSSATTATIAMAGATPISIDGDLLFLEFKLKTAPGVNAVVDFANELLNEGDPAVTCVSGAVRINASPEAFELITPANNSTVTTQPLNLSWEQAVDNDEDDVQYSVLLSKNLYELENEVIGTTEQTSFTVTELDSGSTYYWRIVATDKYGAATLSNSIFTFNANIVTSVSSNPAVDNPDGFALYGNYPNPFNPETAIKYALPKEAHVSIEILNLLGQRIATLIDSRQTAGYHTVFWNGKDFSGHSVGSGIYLYMMQTEEFMQVKKLTLLR